MAAAMSPVSRSGQFLTVSFSGAGHLLPYHLGVASSLLRRGRACGASPSQLPRAARPLPPVKAVAGSSAGAIAAVAFSRLPNCVDELAQRIISDRGRASHHLREMLHESERRRSSGGSSPPRVDVEWPARGRRSPSLHVSVTRCADGRPHLFSFSGDSDLFRTISAGWDTDRILRCVEASCRIPRSFHPVDVLSPGMFGGDPSYPDEDGVCIDGEHYVDGGIAAPAPPTPHDGEGGAVRVVVSPISGGAPSTELGVGGAVRISPADPSWSLLPVEVRCRGDFLVRPSIQNVRAIRVSLGAGSGEELAEWYERGLDDGERVVGRLAF